MQRKVRRNLTRERESGSLSIHFNFKINYMTTLADTPDTSEILPEIFDSKESHLLLDIESSEWKRQKIDNATFISPIPLFDTDTRTETIYPLWIFDIAINKTNRIVQFQFKNSSGALGY